MSVLPKAPPVYKPIPLRLGAPPPFRQNQVNAPSAQLKPGSNFTLETRPAPPVYRPQKPQSSLQQKPNSSFQLETRPAPPVYSPQRKSQPDIQLKSPNFRLETVPAPIYRPQVQRGLQLKAAMSLKPESSPSSSQNKANSLRTGNAGNVDGRPRPVPLVTKPSIPTTGQQASRKVPAAAWLAPTVQRMEAAVEEIKEVKVKAVKASVVKEESSAAIPDDIFLEVQKIVLAAAKAGGQEVDHHGGLGILKVLLSDKSVKSEEPSSSEATYAIASDAYANVYASGPQKFVEAVQDISSASDVGRRGGFVHGESHIFIKKPGITSVAATQDNCLFCYGFLETRKIGHQRLRASPFPKGWIHPSAKFKLKLVNPAHGPKGKLIWITFGEDTRLYRIDQP